MTELCCVMWPFQIYSLSILCRTATNTTRSTYIRNIHVPMGKLYDGLSALLHECIACTRNVKSKYIDSSCDVPVISFDVISISLILIIIMSTSV